MYSSRKDDGFERRYPTQPVVAVSAVVRNGENKVVLVRRGRPPGKGKWSLPGGAIRLGEPVLQALKREIREECGLEVKIAKLLAVHDRIFRDRNGKVEYHYVIVNYLADASGPVQPGGDVLEARWAGLDEMERMELTAGIRELVEKAVGKGMGE